jgi:hypothetical protein
MEHELQPHGDSTSGVIYLGRKQKGMAEKPHQTRLVTDEKLVESRVSSIIPSYYAS